MAWSDLRVDVGLWNLGVVAAAAGCGPLIPSGGDTDTDGPTDDEDDPNDDDTPSPETGNPTTATPTTTLPPGTDTDPWSCAGGCDPGYVCIDGACIPDDECYYNSGGYGYCCGYYDYDCCYYGCPENECYYAEECGGGWFCVDVHSHGYYECEHANPLPACDADDVQTRIIAIPDEVSGGAIALAFGDAEAGGALELLVVQPGQARVVANGGASVLGPVELLTAESDASATAVGDGFAVSSPTAEGTQFVGLSMGALAAGPSEQIGLAGIVGGDFDHDGTDDIVGYDDFLLTFIRGTGSGFSLTYDLDHYAAGPLVTGHFGGDPGVDVAVHMEYEVPIYIHNIDNAGTGVGLYGQPAVTQTMVGADYDGNGFRDLVGITASDDVLLLFPWSNSGDGSFTWEWPKTVGELGANADGHYVVGGGDFDGDGYEDVFIGSTSTLRVLFGQPFEAIRCYADIPIPHAATVLAVGDLDGDGRADAAFSDGTTITVLARQ